MIVLNIEHVKKSYGAESILEDIHFDIQDDARLGLIGRNGAGKTTLFKVISGKEDPTEGFVHRAKGAQIGYLEQIPKWPENMTVMETLESAFKDLTDIHTAMRNMEKQMGQVGGEALEDLMENYDRAQKEYEIGGGYDIEEKLGRITTGLKLESFIHQSFETLSGGEKTRAMLGRLLLEAPDILLLDEPTNHLDVESVEWLESFLKEYRGAVLIVSHDRYFLDRTVNTIVEIERKTSRVWQGNYSKYMAEKDEWLRQQLKAYENQQRKIRAMEEAAQRFRIWGEMRDSDKMYARAKSMEKRIDRIDKMDKPFEDQSNIKLNFESSGRSGKEVLSMENISAGYDKIELFKNVDMDLRFKDRVALVGRNGIGKSTLFKLILGTMEPMDGRLRLGARTHIGYLAQDIAFEAPDRTVLEYFNAETGYNEGPCRSKLARFLFIADDVYKKVSSLSGGEKVRLKLCLMMEQGINFLIMDEPTNHVDIPSREMLEMALENFDGTILFISHDRYLINRIADRILELTEDGLTDFEGNYEAFRALKEALLQARMNADNAEKEKKAKNYRDSDEKRMKNAEKRRVKKLEKLEQDLAEKEVQISDVEGKLHGSELEYDALMKQYDILNALKSEYDTLMEEWMSLQD
ncbi:ribosomal protection-like ABC-F family protein [Fusibacter sp. JL216-2]|uniref:ribosomal protection-like ABC-F family protein n=1 Tax=Fusibacter sp. JL216-2 TaxID=3071453 RepID=UPI003D358057